MEVLCILFVMFLCIILIFCVNRMVWKEHITSRDCEVCKKYGTEDCPDSLECYSTEDKPHFEDKED